MSLITYKKRNQTIYHKKVTSEEFSKGAGNSNENNYISKLTMSNKKTKTSNGTKDKISIKIETKENLPNLKKNIQNIFSNDENKKKAIHYLMQVHKDENKSTSTNFNKMLNKIPEKDKQAKLKSLETSSNKKSKRKFLFSHIPGRGVQNFRNSFKTVNENKKFIIDDEPLNQNDIYFDNNINPNTNFGYSNRVIFTDVNDFNNNNLSKARETFVSNGQQKILNEDLDDFTFKNNYNEYIYNSNKCKMRILNKYIIKDNNKDNSFKRRNTPFQTRNNTNNTNIYSNNTNNTNNSSNNKSNLKNITCDKDNIIQINSMKNLYQHHNIYNKKKTNYNISNNNYPKKSLYQKNKTYFDLSGNKDIQIINKHIQGDLQKGINNINNSDITNKSSKNKNNEYNEFNFCGKDFDDVNPKNSFKKEFYKFYNRNNHAINVIQFNLNKKMHNKDNGMIINKDSKEVEWKIMGMISAEEGNSLKRKNKELYNEVLRLKIQIDDLKKENEKLKDDIINNMIFNDDDK